MNENAQKTDWLSGSATPGAQAFVRHRCRCRDVHFFLAACTSLTPLSHDAQTLQAEIRTGQTLQHGDRIRVVTKGGVTRRLSVAFVEGDVLTGYLDTDPPPPVRVDARGNDASERERRSLVHIPISDIVVVEKEELSAGKSAAALGVGYLAFVGIVVIMALISL